MLGTLALLVLAALLEESPTLEKAAARLGITPTTQWRKRKRWGLE
jgi:hypothetical protein